MTTRRPAPATDGLPLLIGAVLLFQGVGRLAGAERRWFIADHLDRLGYLDFLHGNETIAYIAFGAAGLAVLVSAGPAASGRADSRAGLAAGSRRQLGAGDPHPDLCREQRRRDEPEQRQQRMSTWP